MGVLEDGSGHPDGFLRVCIDVSRFRHAFAEQFAVEVVSVDILFDQESRTSEIYEPGRGNQLVIKFSGSQKLRTGVNDHEVSPIFIEQYVLFDTQAAQPFRSCTFHEFEVIGEIHESLGIRVFIVDPDWPLERGLIVVDFQDRRSGLVKKRQLGRRFPRGGRQAEMHVSIVRRDPAPGCTHHKALLNQVGFDDVFYRASLLTDSR